MKFLDGMGDFCDFACLCRKNILSSAHEDARTEAYPASFMGPDVRTGRIRLFKSVFA